ncbi:Uncharacterized protein TPAR_02561 [Tolypocladium paradoxum]|uniref:Uncharacterized protein n=1 Tax=Tolypocladium paradoxum TaxID=94208 RepID=A0A2S4L466_9HYPO|nr:Uncharacterized protein TPAR_02561 [Tolypocladium paradoxum]
MKISDFLDGARGPRFLLLGQVLHNYVHRRWFRPYRSEIEHHRFIYKFITPEHLPYEGESPSQSTVDSLVSLNGVISAEVEARRRAYDEQLSLADKVAAWELNRPLFRALLIVVYCQNYRGENSKTVGRLPVFLVRTGVEDGLGAPVTFEPIANKIDGYAGETTRSVRTTLETAIDFVIDLEAREAAVFRLQPDPIAAWKHTCNDYGMKYWKWVRGDEPLVGPSSKFVDTEKYPVWGGMVRTKNLSSWLGTSNGSSVWTPSWLPIHFRHRMALC